MCAPEAAFGYLLLRPTLGLYTHPILSISLAFLFPSLITHFPLSLALYAFILGLVSMICLLFLFGLCDLYYM